MKQFTVPESPESPRNPFCVTVRNPKYQLSLVLDLRTDHDRFDSSSDPYLNGHLHYPNDIDRSLNETTVDKIRTYHTVDTLTMYNNNPPNSITVIPVVSCTSGRLHSEFVCLLFLFLQVHREPDRFLTSSRVQLSQHDGDQVHYRH